MSYKEALQEIEALLARATELIAHCRAKLRKAEEDVNDIIANG